MPKRGRLKAWAKSRPAPQAPPRLPIQMREPAMEKYRGVWMTVNAADCLREIERRWAEIGEGVISGT